MQDIEQKIREVNSTMAMEGMPLTEDDRLRLHDVLSGKTNADTIVKQLVDKHSRKDRNVYERA
jgi:hypothetical protein